MRCPTSFTRPLHRAGSIYHRTNAKRRSFSRAAFLFFMHSAILCTRASCSSRHTSSRAVNPHPLPPIGAHRFDAPRTDEQLAVKLTPLIMWVLMRLFLSFQAISRLCYAVNNFVKRLSSHVAHLLQIVAGESTYVV